MAPFEISTYVESPPETIWSVNFAPMAWEKWDPDVVRLEGAKAGLAPGTTFTIVRKNEIKLPVAVTAVKPNVSFSLSGAALMGGLTYTSAFALKPIGPRQTEAFYTVELGGFLGTGLSLVAAQAVSDASHSALNNIKCAAEATAPPPLRMMPGTRLREPPIAAA
jgi:hypothetical protein